MFTRRFSSWTDADWLANRVDKWVAQCQGYTRLRTRRLSRGCQTMLDRPSPQKLFWSRSDSELLDALTRTDRRVDTVDNDTNGNGERTDESSPQKNMNLSAKQLQYDEDVANYIAYLNKPIINMNDHYIEIHQYHYEPGNLVGFMAPEEPPIRPPTRRKKHRINLNKTEIVENKGMNTIKNPDYSEFLVKRDSETSRSIRIVSGRSSDEENKNPEEELDRHRELSQASAVDRRVDTVVKVKRGQTFSTRPLTPVDPPTNDFPRGFLSFRTSKKNKSGRRKKRVVVGEAGIDGPIWPAVLLTFDRSISPGPSDPHPDESQV